MDYSKLPDNKYIKCYIRLIESRFGCSPVKMETEKHHIFPVSIFGKNKTLVNLTFRQHYVAHMLLWKGYRKQYGSKHADSKRMLKAVASFSMQPTRVTNPQFTSFLTSRAFAEVRRLAAIDNVETTTEMWKDPEIRARLTAKRQEFWSKQESRNAQSAARQAFFETEEGMLQRQIVSEHFKLLYSTDEAKEKLREPERLKNSFHSEEAAIKRKASLAAGGSAKSRETYMTRFTPEQRSLNASKAIAGTTRYVNLITLEFKMLREVPDGAEWVKYKSLSKAEKADIGKRRKEQN